MTTYRAAAFRPGKPECCRVLHEVVVVEDTVGVDVAPLIDPDVDEVVARGPHDRGREAIGRKETVGDRADPKAEVRLILRRGRPMPLRQGRLEEHRLPRRARHDGLSGRLEAGMIVNDNELHAAHSAFQKALEELPPVVFGRAEFEAAALCGCSDCASATHRADLLIGKTLTWDRRHSEGQFNGSFGVAGG